MGSGDSCQRVVLRWLWATCVGLLSCVARLLIRLTRKGVVAFVAAPLRAAARCVFGVIIDIVLALLIIVFDTDVEAAGRIILRGPSQRKRDYLLFLLRRFTFPCLPFLLCLAFLLIGRVSTVMCRMTSSWTWYFVNLVLVTYPFVVLWPSKRGVKTTNLSLALVRRLGMLAGVISAVEMFTWALYWRHPGFSYAIGNRCVWPSGNGAFVRTCLRACVS